MSLLPIRKPRPFAGRKGQSIKDLYSSAMGAKGVISVKPLTTPNSRYNTQAVVLVKEAERIGAFPDNRTIVYKRLHLDEVFRFINEEYDGQSLEIATEKEIVHPLSAADVLRILNGQFGCDLEEDDVTIENTCCTEYTLTAKEQSTGYIGQAVICIGRELIYDCSGSPHVTDEFEITGRVSITLASGEVYEGTIEEIAAQMNQATTHGVRVVLADTVE